jgi:hypothetical protein
MKKHLVFSLIVCLSALILGTTMASSPNGRGGVTPAYYDDELFTINLKPFPPDVAANLIEHNKSINIIYRAEDVTLPGDGSFIDVIDAIQGDGFNPLWQEFTVVFNVTPFQLTSDTDVLAAADAGLITLVETDEVYRCSVIGPNK